MRSGLWYAFGLACAPLLLIFWRSPFVDELFRWGCSRGNPPKYRHRFRLRRIW